MKITDTELCSLPQLIPFEAVISPKELKEREVITPFCEKGKRFGLSYGPSYSGYDIRMAGMFKRPKFSIGKKMLARLFNYPLIKVGSWENIPYEEEVSDYYVIPAHSMVLSVSVEYFKVPVGMIGVTSGKSTLARVGIRDICTILEGGWEGHLTLEIFNYNDYPVEVAADMAITQVVFYRSPVGDGYFGKYQGQSFAPTEAR